MSCLYIIIPAYNEEENIEQCVNDWYPIVERHNEGGTSFLVIVNDGSTDYTFNKLYELAKTKPRLKCLTKKNGGHGSSVLYGYRYAIENHADWIFQTDSDGQTNPEEFEQFWNYLDQYDAIIGNRKKRGDGLSRKAVQVVVCFLLWVFFGVKVPDANAPYRLMKATLIEKYIDKLPVDYNIPNIMLTTYFEYFKEKTIYIPISFKPRGKGTNSINIKKIFKIGWEALRSFKRLRKTIIS